MNNWEIRDLYWLPTFLPPPQDFATTHPHLTTTPSPTDSHPPSPLSSAKSRPLSVLSIDYPIEEDLAFLETMSHSQSRRTNSSRREEAPRTEQPDNYSYGLTATFGRNEQPYTSALEGQPRPSQNQQDQRTEDNQENEEVNLAAILQQLTHTLNNIRPVVQPPRETKLVDLPTFRGGEQDPLTWLDEFNNACTANHISATRKLEIIPSYLKGIAHSWWITVHNTLQHWDNNHATARSFTHQFNNKWITSHQKSRWLNQLRSRKQRTGETVDEYLDAVTQLYARVSTIGQYPEEDMMRQFINGLRDELREQVEIACPANMQEAVNKAHAVEAAYSGHKPLSAYSSQRNYLGQSTDEIKDIKETLSKLSEGFQQLVVAQTQNRTRDSIQQEPRTCHNCGRKGHIARNCRSPRANNGNNNNNNSGYNNGNRRCFTCNQTGHLAVHCPQRNQSNPTNGNTGTNNQSAARNTSQNTTRNHWLNLSMRDFVESMNQHLNE